MLAYASTAWSPPLYAPIRFYLLPCCNSVPFAIGEGAQLPLAQAVSKRRIEDSNPCDIRPIVFKTTALDQTRPIRQKKGKLNDKSIDGIGCHRLKVYCEGTDYYNTFRLPLVRSPFQLVTGMCGSYGGNAVVWQIKGGLGMLLRALPSELQRLLPWSHTRWRDSNPRHRDYQSK